MSNQQYERSDQAVAYSKFRLEPPQDLLDIIMSYLSEEVPMPFDQAIDVGCGSGQSTIVLAPYFRTVIGCDVSKLQIREATLARKVSNVKYRVAPAESLPVSDKSVHLITAATCFHWFERKEFFKEVDRVLVPEGVLAIYTTIIMYPITGDEETDKQLKFLTDKFVYDDLKPYRCYKVEQIFKNYKDTEFPFEDIVKVENIVQTNFGSVADAIGHIKSMSSFQNFKAADSLKADESLQDYEDSIMHILKANTTPALTQLLYKRDYFLIMCRKYKKTSKIFEN